MPLPRFRSVTVTAVAITGLLGFGIAGCSSSTPKTSPSLPPAKVTWAPCTEASLAGVECGTMEVPVDWDNPGGSKLSISVARHKATGTPEQRIGSLFWNPGGPGVEAVGTATDLWKSMSENMRQRFDLVSMDPRGVGKSQPDLSSCEGLAMTTRSNWPVDWKAMAELSMDEAAKLNKKCQEQAPNAGFVGTWQVVRDLDALRAAVGDPKLTYLGVSYGSRIGYTYALTFPDRVRALVLNGEVSPDNNKLINPVGPDEAMQVFAKEQPEAWKKFQKTVAHLEKTTLPGGEQPITRERYVENVMSTTRLTAQKPGYELMAKMIDNVYEAWQTGQGYKLPENGNIGIGLGVKALVGCLDASEWPSTTDVQRMVTEAQQRAPLEGGYNAIDAYTRCSGFTFQRKPIPGNQQVNSEVKALLGNSTFDPQTPYAPALEMRRMFNNAPLLTYEGTAHSLWLDLNDTCVDKPIDDFFVNPDQTPAREVSCPGPASGMSPPK